MTQTIDTFRTHHWRMHKISLSNLFIYSILFVTFATKQSFQQTESTVLKSEPFYIDLEHRLSSNTEFKTRGSILVRPRTDYRPAQASFVQPQSELSDSELEILRGASERGDTYYLRSSFRKKRADSTDPSTKVTQTIVKSCSLYVANLADTLVINLNPLNNFVSVNLFTNNQECDGEVPQELSRQFNTTLLIDSGSLGPQPDTATHIKRLEEERQSKLKEGKEDNRSFLAKYWIYIVPAVIILMMMGGPEQGAR